MVPSTAVLWLLVRLFRPDVGSKLSQIFCVAVPAIGCCTIFYLMGILLRIGEITLLRDMLGSRLKRFRKKTEGNA